MIDDDGKTGGRTRESHPIDSPAGPDAREVALALLAARAPEATLCPSEVARAVAAHAGTSVADWRDAMPAVHAAVDRLMAEGLVALSWKGRALAARAGPYRIRHGARDEQ